MQITRPIWPTPTPPPPKAGTISLMNLAGTSAPDGARDKTHRHAKGNPFHADLRAGVRPRHLEATRPAPAYLGGPRVTIRCQFLCVLCDLCGCILFVGISPPY